jgi:hypothetical protein
LLEEKLTKAHLAFCLEQAMKEAQSPADVARARSEFRARVGPLFRPETTTEGEAFEILIPSANQAQCLMWGGMWAAKDTADDLRKMGFKAIRCASRPKPWIL